jgi:hypothetical protein
MSPRDSFSDVHVHSENVIERATGTVDRTYVEIA